VSERCQAAWAKRQKKGKKDGQAWDKAPKGKEKKQKSNARQKKGKVLHSGPANRKRGFQRPRVRKQGEARADRRKRKQRIRKKRKT